MSNEQNKKTENLFNTEQEAYEAVQQSLDGIGDMTANDQAMFAKALIYEAMEYLNKEELQTLANESMDIANEME